jgi:hypothetical protein
MTTPVEYGFCTPDMLGEDYKYFCTVVGLEPTAKGWGFLHCVDEAGNHSTRATDDVPFLRLLIAANRTKALGSLVIPPDKFPIVRAGWPDEWKVAS